MKYALADLSKPNPMGGNRDGRLDERKLAQPGQPGFNDRIKLKNWVLDPGHRIPMVPQLRANVGQRDMKPHVDPSARVVKYEEYVLRAAAPRVDIQNVVAKQDAVPPREKCLDKCEDAKKCEDKKGDEDLHDKTVPEIRKKRAPTRVGAADTTEYFAVHSRIADKKEKESVEERRRRRRQVLGVKEEDIIPTLLEGDFDDYKSDVYDRREKIKVEHCERIARRGQLESRMDILHYDEEFKEKSRTKLAEAENQCLLARQHEYRKDNFEIIKTLGQGGFGTVYKVTYRGEKKVMALKQMTRSALSSKNDIEHLFSETNCMATVYTSDYFPLLYATFADTENVYLLMEYLEGGDVITLLQQMTRFPECMTRFYIAELIEAVDFVHRAGYVHRDIKPDNLCFTKEGHLKLLDFGLSKEDPGMFILDEDDAGRLLKSHLGTPFYMAPEIISATGYTASVDIWAVGCVFFECLAGTTPFTPVAVRGDTQSTYIKKIYNLIKSFDTVLPPLYTKYLAKRYMSRNAVAFCRGVFAPAPMRLTLNEMRMHPFFEQLNFRELHTMQPPYQPAIRKDGIIRTHKPRAGANPDAAAESLGREDFGMMNFEYDVAARAPNIKEFL